MGPSRTRDVRLLAQRGRFHEGSMRDRASAAPPLQFLDPSERVLMVPFCATGTDAAAAVGGSGGGGGAEEKRRSSKMKTNIFGQMWEGVRGRLRIRRDEDKDKGEEEEEEEEEEQRPTRDQVLANYHQLVASGFFSSHAIQSTRHGPPPPPRPCTSRGPPPPTPPQWPLAPAVPVPGMMPDDDDDDDDDKKMTGHASPRAEVCSPASVASSSRGTKRAAAGPPPGDGEGEGEADRDDEGGDEATRAHRFLPKRLRRTAPRDRDRDIVSLPRLRGVASRNKGAHDAPAQAPRAGRGPTDHDDVASSSLGRKIKRPARARNLRTRAAAGGSSGEPLSVMPDANRGIPRVPAVPAKFTYGEDGREIGESTR
ncbi:hypothetical protein C2857_003977 [Epichloe festucae Fl1]|uniref:Uncharacterized protein n=1 Tax=Epichloe festucae (strain Fl1) TaxID=877507 RepID=A0A7S9KUZ5_EPIFF|nr:hypothetical protein C2857_003977 [Epichloe festucae Fl1]